MLFPGYLGRHPRGLHCATGIVGHLRYRDHVPLSICSAVLQAVALQSIDALGCSAIGMQRQGLVLFTDCHFAIACTLAGAGLASEWSVDLLDSPIPQVFLVEHCVFALMITEPSPRWANACTMLGLWAAKHPRLV